MNENNESQADRRERFRTAPVSSVEITEEMAEAIKKLPKRSQLRRERLAKENPSESLKSSIPIPEKTLGTAKTIQLEENPVNTPESAVEQNLPVKETISLKLPAESTPLNEATTSNKDSNKPADVVKPVEEAFNENLEVVEETTENPDGEMEPKFPKTNFNRNKVVKEKPVKKDGKLIVFVVAGVLGLTGLTATAVAYSQGYFDKGSSVTTAPVESVVGKDVLEDAIARIDFKGKNYKVVSEELQSQQVPVNITFIDDNPDGKLFPGEVVSITAGKNSSNKNSAVITALSPLVKAPDWAGKTQDEISKESSESGFKVKFVEEQSSNPPGTAVRTSIEPGQEINIITDEITVSIAIPKEIKGIVVPDISGKTEIEATTILAEKGFTEVRFLKVKQSDKNLVDKVIAVSPSVGDKADNNTDVVVVIGE